MKKLLSKLFNTNYLLWFLIVKCLQNLAISVNLPFYIIYKVYIHMRLFYRIESGENKIKKLAYIVILFLTLQ